MKAFPFFFKTLLLYFVKIIIIIGSRILVLFEISMYATFLRIMTWEIGHYKGIISDIFSVSLRSLWKDLEASPDPRVGVNNLSPSD